MKDYDSDVFDDIGMVVIDEVHRTGTEVFSRALQKVNFRYSLGLSATVKRKDGLTKAFVWFIGDIVYKVARRSDRMDVVMREFFAADDCYCAEVYSYSKLNTSRMLNNVCDFEPRTRLLVDIIHDVYERSGRTRRFLVLSDRKSQLRRLMDLFTESKILTSGFYVGGMKPAALDESLKREVILATFAFASEGFDAQHLDTLVLASPKTDIEQSVGRILRVQSSGRTNIPLVLDIVDGFSMFERQADKRRKFYKSHGYTTYFQAADFVGSVMEGVDAVDCNDDGSDADDDGGEGALSSNRKNNGCKLVKLPVCAFVDE
jgi:superfamily II DNA or RNA helicase